MKYLLNTNICIYIIKKKPIQVLERFKSLPLGEIGISSITLSELQYGVQKSAKPDQNGHALNHVLLPMEIKEFDFFAADKYGVIRANLERKGTPISPMDTLITAHALSMGSTLVTNNEKEFSRIKDLKIENWVYS